MAGTNYNDLKLNQYEIEKIQYWFEKHYSRATAAEKATFIKTLETIPGVYFDFIENAVIISEDKRAAMHRSFVGMDDKNPAACEYHMNDAITDDEIKEYLDGGVADVQNLFSRIATEKPPLKSPEKAFGYHNAFTIKNETTEAGWQDRFVKWYAEYTRGSANHHYLAVIQRFAKMLPDEYCEFFEKSAIGVNGESQHFNDHLSPRNPYTFAANLDKAIVDRDPRFMEALLMDIVNGSVPVKDPQRALNYFEETHGFEKEFMDNAIDPTGERIARETEQQISGDRLMGTLLLIDDYNDLQKLLIADMDAKRPALMAEKARELNTTVRARDHEYIRDQASYHVGLRRTLKTWSMRWQAYQKRKEVLAGYGDTLDFERKYEAEKLKKMQDLQKELKQKGDGAAIPGTLIEQIEVDRAYVCQQLDLRGVSYAAKKEEEQIKEPAQEVEEITQNDAQVEEPAQTRFSMAERLSSELGRSTTVQTPVINTEQPEVENTKEELEDPEAENG